MIEYVYVLSNSAMPGLLKIGFTTKPIEERVRDLFETGVPTPFDLEMYFETVSGYSVEQELHERLHSYRYNDRREFFQCTVNQVLTASVELGLTPLLVNSNPNVGEGISLAVPADVLADTGSFQHTTITFDSRAAKAKLTSGKYSSYDAMERSHAADIGKLLSMHDIFALPLNADGKLEGPIQQVVVKRKKNRHGFAVWRVCNASGEIITMGDVVDGKYRLEIIPIENSPIRQKETTVEYHKPKKELPPTEADEDFDDALDEALGLSD